MQTKLKDLWEKVKGFFAKLNKKTRILLGVCAAVILVVIIAAAILLNRKEYAVLQGGLNASEISTVVSFLDANGVTDYQVQGDKVLVPKGRETQLQIQLATSGNLNSGFLYEYYSDKIGAISTSDERDRAFLIASQERLAATIRQLEEVQDATVQITPGTERVYVLDPQATPAEAYVTVTPVSRNALSSGTVSVIRDLVKHSVQGLEIEHVGIGDTYGNSYSDSSSSSTDSVNDASTLKMQYEEQLSNRIRMQVREAIENIYGKDNVDVTVNCNIDVNRKVVDSTTYHQPDGSVEGGGLIGKDEWLWEIIRDGTDPVGGTVGTTTNSDIPYQAELQPELNGDENYANGSGSRLHQIDTITEQTEVLAFNISDIRVAVTINQNCPNASSLSTEALRSHVATASGIGGENPENYVSVVIAPFNVETPPSVLGPIGILSGVPDWVLFAAIGGMILFIILLIIILILRGRAKKRRQAQEEALAEEMQAAEALAAAEAAAAAAAIPEGGADIMEVNTEKSMELRKTVRQFAQNNPEVAAQMVKAWLRGDDDNG